MTPRRRFLGGALALTATAGCAGLMSDGGWITLVDGAKSQSLDAFTEIGEGNWNWADGTLQGRAAKGKMGYLVTKQSFMDFEIRAEFWADADCNSGLFIRCADTKRVGADNAYEVNIFDKRPDPSYGTGAIVDVAKVPVPGPKAADRWNTFEITARGDRLVVVFNGQQTVDVRNGKLRSGPLALQSAGGTIRFKTVRIRSI